MNEINVNSSFNNNNKLSFGKKQKRRNNVGFYKGSYAGGAVGGSVGILSLGIGKLMKKTTAVGQEDAIHIRRAASEGLKQTGLYDKGVRVLTMDEVQPLNLKERIENLKNAFNVFVTNMQSQEPDTKALLNTAENMISPYTYTKKDGKALAAIREEIELAQKEAVNKSNNFFGRFAKQKAKVPQTEQEKAIADLINRVAETVKNAVTRLQTKKIANQFKIGSNAAFLERANKIILPGKSLNPAVFHEMGHALNANGGKILKVLQKSRPLAMAVPGIILTMALLNPRKRNEEKSDSKIQNLKDTVKRNAGKLSFIAMLPVVAEEAIASLRGQKIAKNLTSQGLLSKDILKKIKINNALALATYVIGAVALGITAKVAVDVKDKAQEKYEIKQEQKAQAKAAKKQARLEAKEAKRQAKLEAKEAKKLAKA